MRHMYILFGLLSALFASLVTIFGKLGLKRVDPVFATSIRAVIMALFFLVTVFVLQKVPKNGLSSLSTTDWLLVIGAGICGALSWLFYFQALKVGPATRVAGLDRLSLVFIAVLSAMILGENFSMKSIVGVILMVGGVYMLTL